MTRQESITEISERLATLTLSEEDLDFDFVVDQLGGLKGEINTLETALDDAEPWLVEWLSAEHLKGSMIYVGAKTNFKKEMSDGRSFPIDPETRAALASRFNEWSVEARSRLALYEASGGSAKVVKSWMKAHAAFMADPVRNP